MRRTPLVALALVVVVVIGACDDDGGRSSFPSRTPVGSPTRTDSWVIGVVGTLSAPEQPTVLHGQDAYEGADLAVQQLNARLPEGERPYEVVTLDDQGDPDRAAEMVTRLARSDRTIGIVYAGPPEALPRTERVLAEAGVPAVLCFGDLYSARRLSPHVFQASPPHLWEARVMARYLLTDRRYEDVALVTSDDFTGRVAARALRIAFRERGSRPDILTWGASGEVVDELLRRRAEAVVIQGAPEPTQGFMRELAAEGALYRGTPRARIASAAVAKARRRNARAPRPQIVSFDAGFGSLSAGDRVVPGTVLAASYARGAHYLPIPSFRRFARAFEKWWDELPTGWELRAYDAASAIGWAHRTGRDGGDVAVTLERLHERRFGGLPVTLGPDDHTFVGMTHVGLWVHPSPRARVRDDRLAAFRSLPRSLRFVPLHRGFSIDGSRTAILPGDWPVFFDGPTDPRGPAPKIKRARLGVGTGRRDPVH